MIVLAEMNVSFKSNLYYTCSITPRRVTRGRAHLRDLALEQQNSPEMSQRWRH